MPSDPRASSNAQSGDLRPFLRKLVGGGTLSEAEAAEAFRIVMSGKAAPAQIGGLLIALAVRGETVAEITGAARAMREKVLRVEAPEGCIDTCGTGGDAKGTYNVSTCAAFVVAGAGVPVAKHGNRSVTSRSGSADVLAALGVKIDCSPETVARCIAECGLGFMFAPAHHAAMKHVAPVRGELGTRTLFNILGPLANPAGAKRQVLGVFAKDRVESMAKVLGALGSECAWVVYGLDGLDELTTTGPSFVAALENGSVRTFEVTPEQAGLSRARAEELQGGEAAANAAAIERVLAGERGAFRDIVLLNAAAALIVAGKAASLSEGAALAAASIDEGRAKDVLMRLKELSQGSA